MEKKHSGLFWWHDQFRVGTQHRVNGGAWVSCCTTVIELEVEDVAGNIIRTVKDQRDNWHGDNWHIIIPVVITIGIIFLIIIIVVSVCVCRRRYNQLSSEYN